MWALLVAIVTPHSSGTTLKEFIGAFFVWDVGWFAHEDYMFGDAIGSCFGGTSIVRASG